MSAALAIPRFYPILDAATIARRGLDVIAAAREILEGGAKILQFRYKGFFSRDVFSSLETIAKLCAESGALFVLNDRADVARMLGSNGFEAGLHLGQEDLTPSEARLVTGNKMPIGFSTHNETQLRAALAQPADYFAFGPMFPTVSKENPDPVVGLDELRRLRALLWNSEIAKPLVAIGGITRSNAPSVIEAGADSVAVIGDLYPANLHPGDGVIRARAAEWLSLLR